MKRMKKIVSLALALIMVFAMTATAFAADNHPHKITVQQNADDKAEHTYVAYQIFKGDLAGSLSCTKEEHQHTDACTKDAEGNAIECEKEEHKHTDSCYERKVVCGKEEHQHTDACTKDAEGNTIKCEKTEHQHVERCYSEYVLSNIEWGNGVSGNELLAALKADKTIGSYFADCEDAVDVAEVLGNRNIFADSDITQTSLTDTFAKIAETKLTTEAGRKTGVGTVEINVTGSGYYLVKDENESVDDENGAYTRFMLQVVGDSIAVVKSEVPSGEKKVFYWGEEAYDNGHTHDDTCDQDGDGKPDCGKEEYTYNPANNKGDANNAGIGDHVTFQITSKVPNYVGYDYYFFIMNDSMSSGLTFDGGASVKVEITDGDKTSTLVGESVKVSCTDQSADHVHGNACFNVTNKMADYYVYEEGDHSFRLAFRDIMETEKDADDKDVQRWPVGSEVVVTYSATVNKDAVIGDSGNKNEWSLEYSKNPNISNGGKKDDRVPGLPIEGDKDVLGETPKDLTLTYVTKLDITKYANGTDLEQVKNYLLQGAEFTLTGTSYQVTASNVEYYKESTKDIADGETRVDDKLYYKLLPVEGVDDLYTDEAPKSTNEDYVEIGVGNEKTEKGYLWNDEKNEYYVPGDKTEYNGKTIYQRVQGTNSKYADVNTTYVKVKRTTTDLTPVDVSIVLTTDEKGEISFKGLGAGKYTLTETITPAGFNTIEPIEFEIVFEAPKNAKGEIEVKDENDKCKWTIVGWPKAVDGSEGITEKGGVFAANVLNMSGSLLPSTGGIGTTIFYVVGGILVIGAGILLVAKKRMGRN